MLPALTVMVLELREEAELRLAQHVMVLVLLLGNRRVFLAS